MPQSAQSLRDDLDRSLKINLGLVPIRNPKGIEEIKLLRILINVLRQAELDYLSKGTPRGIRAKASQTLFGLHLSPMPAVCRLLGLDCHKARLKLIEWKLKGMVGDPVFDFLTRPEVANRYEMGKITDFSSIEDDYGQEENDYLPDL